MKNPGRAWLLVATLLMSGCGYHLPGQQTLPASVQACQLQLQGPPSFQTELRRQLQQAGWHSNESGDCRLVITRYLPRKQALAFTANRLVREYEIGVDVRFVLERPSDQWRSSELRAGSHQLLNYSESGYLGKGYEEAQIRQQMEDDLASQIIWRLRGLEWPAPAEARP